LLDIFSLLIIEKRISGHTIFVDILVFE